MAARTPVPWGGLAIAVAVGATLAGVVVWRGSLQFIDTQIKSKRSTVKKLILSGGIPPDEDVMRYLRSRETSLEHAYRYWLERVVVTPPAEAAGTNPQLLFQERFRDQQRMLERLSTARSKPIPELLGFPKDLPPSDTVPRLLVQLSLIQDAAGVILEQGVSTLTSLKVEDPEAVQDGKSEGAFLLRLPVRVRMAGSLLQTMQVLGAFERAKPIIDVRALRVGAQPSGEELDVELVLARYLTTAAEASLPSPETPASSISTGKPHAAVDAAGRSASSTKRKNHVKSSAGREP